MLRILLCVIISSFGYYSHAQIPGCDGTRYLSEIFTSVDTTADLQFGFNTTFSGNPQNLFLNVYEPSSDTLSQRPVIFVAYGGSFIGGERGDVDWLCRYYARCGFVAVAIDYRLYDGALFPLPDSADFTDVVIKAMGDMKAAIRYMREDAATANQFRINPNMVIVSGISAGGILASHVGFVDSTDTFEAFVLAAVQANGGWEGNSSTNYQYSSDVNIVVNYSGALRDEVYIDANDPPLFSAHDDGDGVVPYAGGYASVFNIPIIYVDGSANMHVQADAVGVTNQLITRISTGHVSYFNDQTWEDSVRQASLDFMHPLMCGTNTSVTDLDKERQTIQVMPNPSHSEINVHMQTNDPLQVELFDLNGRLVQSWQAVNSSFTIQKGNKTGMYILRVSGNDYLSFSKLVWR